MLKKALLLAVALGLCVRFFVAGVYRVPTDAMAPLARTGDWIVGWLFPFGLRVPGVDEALIAGRVPRLGEIDAVVSPDDASVLTFRRVVGLPGDRIEIAAGQLIRNGRTAVEVATAPPAAIADEEGLRCFREKREVGRHYDACLPAAADAKPFSQDPVSVPEGSAYVLGDYRAEIRLPNRIGKGAPVGFLAKFSSFRTLGAWLLRTGDGSGTWRRLDSGE